MSRQYLSKGSATQILILPGQINNTCFLFFWPFKSLFIQAFVPETETITLPVHYLDFISLAIAKSK